MTQRLAEVDLGAVRHNVGFLLERLPAGTRLFAVVKADGYGHGAPAVGRAALEAGAWGLAVATADEAGSLRSALGALLEPERLLVMGGLAPQEAATVASLECAITCHSPELAAALERSVPSGRRLAIHLKVDTGMNRLGCSPSLAPALAQRIARSRQLYLAGVYTHFAAADSDPGFTRAQLARFREVLAQLGVDPGLRHAANSAAALRYPEAALDAVRCGLAIYGCGWPGLRPALSLRALVTQVKEVPPGVSVGYGRTWRARRPSTIATVAIGYEDGVLRSRSNRGEVVIGGRRAPLVGRVSMDQITVDVTDLPGLRAGQWVTLIGDGITAEEVAVWSRTIPYEVLTAIGRRVERRYLE